MRSSCQLLGGGRDIQWRTARDRPVHAQTAHMRSRTPRAAIHGTEVRSAGIASSNQASVPLAEVDDIAPPQKRDD